MELVGRRLLCVNGRGEELQLSDVASWSWRAGVIRAVTSRDTDSPTTAVCVEWDGEPAAEHHWRRLKEEWEVFVLEHELVWARRSSTPPENSSPQLALVFRPLTGQNYVNEVAVVEFLSDRQLEFYTDREKLRPCEVEVNGVSSILRENPACSQQLTAWLRQRHLQHILQPGHGCVKGLRVKVFRPDSKPQWLHGFVSNYDDNSGTMTVLSNQEAEPLRVDPALVHVLFLDDISPSLLMKETSTTEPKPQTNNTNRTNLNTENMSSNTTATDQACNSGPVQRKLCKQNSNCSPAEDKTEGMREGRRADDSRADSATRRTNYGARKKRKALHEEEQNENERRRTGLKRLKNDIDSDLSEGAESEGSNIESKSLSKKYCTLKKTSNCQMVHGPTELLEHDLKAHSSSEGDLSPSQLSELESQQVQKSPPLQFHLPSTSGNREFGVTRSPQCTLGSGCNKAEEGTKVEVSEMEDRREGTSQEDSEAVSALLASQESEQLVSMETACMLLHTLPPECNGREGEPSGDPEVRKSTHTEVITPSCNSSETVQLESKVHLSQGSSMSCSTEVGASKVLQQTLTNSPGAPKPVHPSPCSSPKVISKPPEVIDISKLKCSASPEVSKTEDIRSLGPTEKGLVCLKNSPCPEVILTPTLQQVHVPCHNLNDFPAQSKTPPQNLARSLTCTPPPDKPTNSPLMIDRNEPFTVYRDPTLVRKELEYHPTHDQSPGTALNLHSKHNLKELSPSSSSPSLTSTNSHTKIVSLAAHNSPLPLPSQTHLCCSHPSIPHPHLLPSFLPSLPASSALLAGHTRLGHLSVPHHPLALQATPPILGQSPGATPLAPLGLYPFFWHPLHNGAHGYPLGLPGSKWSPSESAGNSDVSLRKNTQSPWPPSTTPGTSAEGQGLCPQLPVRPSSVDPQRMSRNVQSSTLVSKSAEEVERRVFTKTQSSVHMPLKTDQEQMTSKIEKTGRTSHPPAADSTSARSKQPQIVYDLTVDRTGRYQEESRRIPQEGVEVAQFTARLGSDRETWYSKSPTISQKERDAVREREIHLYSHNVPARLQSAQPSPTLTQSSYYSPASDSVENMPSARRAPPSKELYEQLSVPNTGASVLHLPSTQNAVKARPPPLVKYQKEEGLLVKITEQLASKAVSVEPLELKSMDRKGCPASFIPGSVSSRATTSLHRAPIFHPPALPSTASKEAGKNRLSPPTLTPIQPISLSGKVQDVHRPPTLMPELRHGAVAGKSVTPDPVYMTSQAHHLYQGKILHSRERVMGSPTTNGVVVNPQAATASVIVRPASYTHPPINHTKPDRSLSQGQCGHVQTFESVSNTHLKDGQCKRGVLWTPVDTAHHNSMITSKQVTNMPLNMTTKNINTNNILNHMSNYSTDACPFSDLVSEQCENKEAGIKVFSKVDPSSTSCCSTKGLPHVKKHRAGLTASKSRQNMQTVQLLHTTDILNSTNNVCHASHSCSTNSLHTVCNTHTQESESVFNPSPPKHPRLAPKVHGVVANKPGSLVQPSVHINQPAQSSQNNYHKLKKAWLTRHSEQDRGSANFEKADVSPTVGVSLPFKQGVNGFDNKWSTQEGKGSSQDNIKSKIPDRMNVPEDRNCRGSNKSNTEDKKPVTEERKAVLEDVKPVLDKNGNLVKKKKPSTQNKMQCVNDRQPSSETQTDFKIEKNSNGEKLAFSESRQNENGGDLDNESENRKCESARLSKNQNKTTFKKKQNGQQRKRGGNEKEEDEERKEENRGKPNGTHRTIKEKSQHRLPSNGIPRSVMKDWRKVKKLKQSGSAFLQDDSCAEIGANVQKCCECRLDRSRKTQETAISPVFCRFYYFRRLSYSKNGVVRVDGFSAVEETNEEAVRVWTAGFEEGERKEMELDTAKYILTLIGDKFCQLVKTENNALTWVRKDTQVMWKRAVRGVREMCDACEATLFNMHWACHKCGFVVCMDCYKAREIRSAKDKELYIWVRCVKNQQHDLKTLMPTQIVPETILAKLQSSMHSIRIEYGIPSQCSCNGNTPFLSRPPVCYSLSQHSERAQFNLKSQKSSAQVPDQQKSTHDTLHKNPTEKKGKLQGDELEVQGRKSSSPEQGSTLRDLLTSTAGKLRLGSTGPGIAFAPVYHNTDQNTHIPNLLDDIIASVVENKIPATKMNKLGLKLDLQTEKEVEMKPEKVKPARIPLADPHTSVPHEWIGSHRLLWLKDHHHLGNQRLFKENWTQEQPVLVSGLHKSLNTSLWKPEDFSKEFSSLHSDFYNCRDGSITNTCVKDFWDSFEDVSKRPKSAKGDTAVYRLKDWPSGEEFLALMPSRYEDVIKSLPIPEYTGPDGALNLASRLPTFFIRPDLGPRLCCAHGVTSCPEQDFGTSNLHVEISDTMSILVYVGIAKGSGALSKAGVLKLLEREALDESAKKRLKDFGETPGALWHIYLSKDLHKIQEFLRMVSAELCEGPEVDSEAESDTETDPLRENSWYLSPKMRQRLLEEYGVECRTLLQFFGDAVIIPAGALHQVMNLHSCVQVNVDFVSPEHAHNSYYLTQDLRTLKDQVNYEDKLQVKNIFYHSVKDAVAALSQHLKEQSTADIKEEEC
ncbi:probable JmjC domain-containing histone demethylation protein 2C [Trichomycterus rosablanca]|uniref:probable JmjC domain-containing histone demethylation protein 2C n=1 Tax=Trichomycterus rosablanca TaxID=2290929 RepID=UPI002F35631D